MTAINIKALRGQVPRTSERLIGANYATAALNCKITSGRLDPLRGLAPVHTSMAAAITTMYRYRFNAQDNWLVWGSVVDVVRSPTTQDALGRLFYTGDGEPRMTSYADAISGAGPYPTGFFVLGVVPPSTAPALVVTGGAAPVETRAYVTTFVTPYSEESAPSPAVVVSGNIDGSWDLSALEAPPPNSGTVSAAAADTPASGFVQVTLDTVRGLAPYEEITLSGITGMTDLNGQRQIVSINGSNVVLALATSQTYTAGGAWAREAPHNTTGMKRRIYRTVGTNTDYKFVAEIAATTAAYSDTVASTALQNAIPAIDTAPPPKNGHSLVALANGALAMVAGNQLCFSEQYKPYSWPIANRYGFAGNGVAACAAGNSVIVLTDQFPILATATVPESASLARLDTYAPCLSKRGTVDVGGGCAYPSHDGLYLVTPGSVKNMTENLYRYDEWQAINPASFKAAVFDRTYYAMHDGNALEQARIMVLDIMEADSITEIDERVDTLYANPWDGKLYAGQGNKILQWDADETNRYLSFWASRKYQMGPPLNFACAQVHARYGDIVPANTSVIESNTVLLANADNVDGAIAAAGVNSFALNGSALVPSPNLNQRRVQFSLLKEGKIVFTRDLNSTDPFRLPAGFKTEIYGVQIASSIPVYSVTVAQSMQELSQAST